MTRQFGILTFVMLQSRDAVGEILLIVNATAKVKVDVTDFEFVPDQTGRILVNLIEADGNRTSAYSANTRRRQSTTS